MGWGGYHGGKGAREVAAAFYTGRKLTRGNARTDGRTYYLFNNPIAMRIPPEDIPEAVARALTSDDAPRMLEARLNNVSVGQVDYVLDHMEIKG